MANVDIGAVAAAVVALCTLGNTALLVWNAAQLRRVNKNVNGAKEAAVQASHEAGYVKGIIESTRPPLRVGNVPTNKGGNPP